MDGSRASKGAVWDESALSMSDVVVIDYGMGNLRSVVQALRFVAAPMGLTVEVTQDADAVRQAKRLVLPGQGAMPDCMHELKASGLLEAVLEGAQNKPLFGVCVGMQMLLESSAEVFHQGDAAALADLARTRSLSTPCLGLFPGEVVKFQLSGRLQADGHPFKVPQMGWNAVRQTQDHPIWAGVAQDSYFYFVHSYYARASQTRHTVGETDYGEPFTSAIARDNIFATQVHPEKSADNGLQLYRNFLSWSP